MNTKKIYQTGLALASLLVVFSSCKKQLEIAPRQSIEAIPHFHQKRPLMHQLPLFMPH